MGIYIKGMKMPKNCGECHLCLVRTWCRLAERGDILFDAIPEWCPLTEVPVPHGRLIDADALMQYFNVYKYEEWTSEEVGELINNALTIIESEVEE